MKKLFTFIAAAAVLLPASNALASERISVHEINKFVKKFDAAINNPDVLVGHSFLNLNLKETASVENTIRRPFSYDYGYGTVYYENGVYSDYYRYPYAYAPHYRPSSLHVDGKAGMISTFQNKKHLIPGFTQQTTIEGTTMPSHAKTAVVDIDVKEFGLRYAGYYPTLTERVLQSNAKCKMHLSKTNGDIKLNRLVCNTVSYLPL